MGEVEADECGCDELGRGDGAGAGEGVEDVASDLERGGAVGWGDVVEREVARGGAELRGDCLDVGGRGAELGGGSEESGGEEEWEHFFTTETRRHGEEGFDFTRS